MSWLATAWKQLMKVHIPDLLAQYGNGDITKSKRRCYRKARHTRLRKLGQDVVLPQDWTFDMAGRETIEIGERARSLLKHILRGK